MKTFTIGEIHRLGLLRNHRGEAYSDKATVSRLVNQLEFNEKQTAWGTAKTLTEEQIKRHNAKWEK